MTRQKKSGRPPAALARRAVTEFTRTCGKQKRIASVGIGRSGRRDVSERAEELLKGLSHR